MNLTNIFVFPSKDKRYVDNTRKSSQTESMIEMDCTQDPNKKVVKGDLNQNQNQTKK